MFYNQIKNYYNQKLYTIDQLDIFVKAGMINEEQKNEIISSYTSN